MGRTTPSFRMAVYKELDRLFKIIELLPVHEREAFYRLLDGIEDTISLYTHAAAPNDPLEPIIIHLIRKIAGELYSAGGMDT